MTAPAAKVEVGLTVIVSSYGAAAHMGAGVETEARTFGLPKEASDYIAAMLAMDHTTVTLAVNLAALTPKD